MSDLVAGYARVSSEGQDVARQVRELEAAGCTRIWSETASGRREATRPEWDALLSHLRDGDELVVTELSRLGRSTADLSHLVDELRDRGVGLRILNLGIDTATPAGRLIFTIVGAVAEMERELLIERTRSGLARAKAEGVAFGRPPTYTDRQVRRAQALLEQGDLSPDEVARAIGMSRSRMYARIKMLPASEVTAGP